MSQQADRADEETHLLHTLSPLLCAAWLFGALVIFCHINVGIEDMLTERGHCVLRL